MHKCNQMPYHIGAVIRIYPSNTQKRMIAKSAGAQRFVYNKLVAVNNELYTLGKTVSFVACINERNSFLADSIADVSSIKNMAPFLYDDEIDAQTIPNAIQQYRRAWTRFKKVPGTSVPTFHKKSYACKYTTNAHYPSQTTGIGDGNVYLTDYSHIHLPKLGRIRFKDSGRLAQIFARTSETRIGNITISMDACGDYYASFQIASMEPFVKPLARTGACCGYDVNIKNFYADSDGNVIPNMRFKNSIQTKIARLQKKLSRQLIAAKKEKRSIYTCKNYQKTRLKLAKAHRKACKQREDYQHVCSKKEVENQDFLFMEDLKVKNLLKNHCLAYAISDVAWSSFMHKMEYKAELYGKTFMKVKPHYTTQTCSCCGYILTGDEKLSLSQREFICPQCGTYQLRDNNAASNIRNRGMAMLPVKAACRFDNSPA